ncbi:hypothetical protein SRHO_G00008800 [Serrasalmus rhombeus]
MNICGSCEGNSSTSCPIEQERSGSLEPCVPKMSDWSINVPHMSTSGHSPIKQEKSGPPEPSCVSMKSDLSMNVPLMFSEGDPTSGLR